MSVELLDVIQPSVFKEQLAAGSVTDTVIQAGTKGLVITLKIGKNGFVLGRTRGGIRYFHAIDGAASVLIQHGITSFCRYKWLATRVPLPRIQSGLHQVAM